MPDIIVFLVNHVYLIILPILFSLWLIVWIYNYFTKGVCKSRARMDGKTVIITGSDSGIGRETALDLAGRGARVIMACINMELALLVRDQIIKKTKNQEVVVKFVDLSSLKSVRKFAEDINNTEKRLDVLIHNAGVMMPSLLTTEDGLNTTMATNHYGPFLLTHLLIDLLKKTGQSRIVVVASRAHSNRDAVVDPDQPNPLEDPPSRKFNFRMYAMSKFACVLCAREMARRLQGKGVTVNTLHPGLVQTSILITGIPKIVFRVVPVLLPFIKTAKEGAQTSIFLAVSELVEGVSGKHFSNCKEHPAAEKADDLELAKRYWRVCEDIVQLEPSDPHI